MRLTTFTLILAAGLAMAGAASAQIGGWEGTQGYTIPGANDGGAQYNLIGPQRPYPRRLYIAIAQNRYNAQVLVLKAKMRQLIRHDGGQLSDEHRAGLQNQLDELNRSFGIVPGHS
jgi:hypothetical protein